MRRLYNSLHCSSLDQGEFLPTQWLISWLGDDEKLGPIDNSLLLCEHGRLNPEKFREYKLVSANAVTFHHTHFNRGPRLNDANLLKADELFGEHLGGPRIKSDALCWDCVTTKCITSQLRSQLDADSKVVSNLMKAKIEP